MVLKTSFWYFESGRFTQVLLYLTRYLYPMAYISRQGRYEKVYRLRKRSKQFGSMDAGLIFVFILFFLMSYFFISKPKGLPPGPLSLPFIGSILFLKEIEGQCAHLALVKASKRYGSVFSFKIASHLIVVLHGHDAVYQALVKQAETFSDRPDFLPGFHRTTQQIGGKGIVFQNHDHAWKALRRLTLRTMRDFGVGKSTIEERIMTEVDAASAILQESKGGPLDLSPIFQKIAGNVINGIVFGRRRDYDDPQIDIIRNMFCSTLNAVSPTNFGLYFPIWLTRLFSKEEGEQSVKRVNMMKAIRQLIFKEISQHEVSYDEHNIRDFVDLFIQMQRNSKIEDEIFTEGNMYRIIMQLFAAGAETTYKTLDFAFLYMITHPDIQKRCQEEISDVIGERNISYDDKPKLKYVEATIMEVQRLANVVPLSLQHCTNQDASFMGYNIPKGTVIMPSLYSAHMDPSFWKDPTKFDPERFLDSKGNLSKNEAMMPFSVGPRTCLGEPLARMELFLVFANLLQRFGFKKERNDIELETVQMPHKQLVVSPYPYKIIIC